MTRNMGNWDRGLRPFVVAIRDEAIELLAPRIDELLGGSTVLMALAPAPVGASSRARALVSLGVSVGANSHELIERHTAAAVELGLSAGEVTAALKMAGYVEKRASEMTAEAATRALDELAGVAAGRGVRELTVADYTT